MLTQQALTEVVTLPEAVALAERLGYSLDRSNLLRYARSGRLIARKSQGTWLTTRSALKALVVELALQPRGRPRAAEPAWATVEPSPDLVATLAEIDDLKAQVGARAVGGGCGAVAPRADGRSDLPHQPHRGESTDLAGSARGRGSLLG